LSTEAEALTRLVAHTEESISFFSNARKHEREQVAVRALLRLLSVQFSAQELQTIPEEPVDVSVAGAAFQVTEVAEQGCRRHLELWRTRDRYLKAKSLIDVADPVLSGVPSSLTPRRVSRAEMISHVLCALARKEARYGARTCSKLDALVYLNLRAAVLALELEITPSVLPNSAPWRSVSVLTGGHALVLAAGLSAPGFLQRHVGGPAVVWPTPWGLWEP
jgi:Putative endonuclease, protein of unknown function (DUF1780)